MSWKLGGGGCDAAAWRTLRLVDGHCGSFPNSCWWHVVVAAIAGSFWVAVVTAGSFWVAAATAGSFRVVAATTSGSLRVAAARGRTILGRMIGEVAPMLRLTLGRPSQTNLVLRPGHKPTGAIPKDHNIALLCAWRLMGGGGCRGTLALPLPT
jgi:hypothetical protein